MSSDILALLALNALPKVGPIRIRRLLSHFGTPSNILTQSTHSLMRVSGIGPEVAHILSRWRELVSPEDELALCEKEGITLLTPDSPAFPGHLTQSPDTPLLLYVRGEITETDQHAIGVVGSRKCTHYGRSCTRLLSSELAQVGYTIISGLARGIDTEAHEAALSVGGRTIAVLGSGLLNLYPAENRDLARRIAEGHGAVISEFPLRCPPDKQTFPQRNRIVAQWSRGLLVTECPSRSGSLITANMASEAGRPVFAVPGPIDRPQSQGCHDLIRDGATLVTSARQVIHDLEQFSFPKNKIQQATLDLDTTLPQASPPSAIDPPAPSRPRPILTEIEEKIFPHLDTTELTMDRIAELSALPIHLVSATLLGLEMKGLVKQLAGQRYVRQLNL